MNKFLGLLGFSEEKQTTVKTEIIAGLVTFLTMAYILTVNPLQILSFGTYDGLSWSSVFMATAFGAIIGTLLMAFLAKMPLAQASGMGLNAMVGGMLAGAFTESGTFMVVLISGIIFLALSVITVKGKTFRELVFDGMPVAVRGAISVGIGLFIAYIGFQGAGIIVASPFTVSDLVVFSAWGEGWKVAVAPAVVALAGLFTIAILDKFDVKGAVIIGILVATVVGIPFGVTPYEKLYDGSVSWKFWENFADFFTVGKDSDSVFLAFTGVFKEGFGASVFTVIMTIITFCMIDMFDTMGTIVGCCGGNRILSDENNKPFNYDKIMISDAVATCAGAMLGTSTVTTFVESGSGVSAGGRTGLTAFVVACLFFLSIFIMPVFAAIPGAATASALIWVGVLMMKNNVKSIDFSNAINSVSAFLTIIVMVLAYSITKGIGIGMVTYTLLSLISYGIEWIIYAINKDKTTTDEEGNVVAVAKPKLEVSIVAMIITALFLVYFLVPTTL